MYTSAIDKAKNARTAVAFLAGCAFCGFFSSVYFKFSHGISSDYMVFLCAVPFVFGVLPYLCLYWLGARAPYGISKELYNWGVITLAAGFLLKGIVEISGYEIDSISILVFRVDYFYLYAVFAAALMLIGIILYFTKVRKNVAIPT